MRRIPALPPWAPSERVIVGLIVLLLVLVASTVGGDPAGHPSAAPPDDRLALAATPTPTAEPSPTPTDPIPTTTAGPTPTLVSNLDLGPGGSGPSPDGAILPHYRIISYYGHPLNTTMGVLGTFEGDLEAMLEAMRAEKAAYEAADPSRPVILALEVIASVAQNWPADDNTYLLHTDRSIIDEYAEFCEENGLLLILDIQIGHSTVAEEIERVRPWLEKPFVHLAIDPEFAMPPGVAPGEEIGSVDASDVAYAQDILGQIVDAHALPPKILIVHRFTEGMIRNAEQLEPVPGVQLVIDFDGFGEPAIKVDLYTHFIRDQGVEFGGIKIFYNQDLPPLTPSETVALDPPPDVVIFH
ncbi:MAG TPA: hypothetical protein VIL01_15320 [Thermomicrobiales bacterium]